MSGLSGGCAAFVTKLGRRTGVARLAAIALALAFGAVASTAAADPATACAAANAAWDRAASGSNASAMRATIRTIPGVCTELMARAKSRYAEVVAENQHREPSARPVRSPPAPPPMVERPPERVATQAEVLGEIRTELLSQGPVVWETYLHDSNPPSGQVADWTVQYKEEFLTPAADGQCRFAFHFRASENDKVMSDIDAAVPLDAVTAVRLETEADNLQMINARSGHPNWSNRIEPTIYGVDAIRNDGALNHFTFYSIDTARRVEALFQKAAQNCGVANVVRE